MKKILLFMAIFIGLIMVETRTANAILPGLDGRIVYIRNQNELVTTDYTGDDLQTVLIENDTIFAATGTAYDRDKRNTLIYAVASPNCVTPPKPEASTAMPALHPCALNESLDNFWNNNIQIKKIQINEFGDVIGSSSVVATITPPDPNGTGSNTVIKMTYSPVADSIVITRQSVMGYSVANPLDFIVTKSVERVSMVDGSITTLVPVNINPYLSAQFAQDGTIYITDLTGSRNYFLNGGPRNFDYELFRIPLDGDSADMLRLSNTPLIKEQLLSTGSDNVTLLLCDVDTGNYSLNSSLDGSMIKPLQFYSDFRPSGLSPSGTYYFGTKDFVDGTNYQCEDNGFKTTLSSAGEGYDSTTPSNSYATSLVELPGSLDALSGNNVTLQDWLPTRRFTIAGNPKDYVELDEFTTFIEKIQTENEAPGPVRFDLIGGDTSLFRVLSNGVFSMQNVMDFENLPPDANSNGLYEVSVKATDSIGRVAVKRFVVKINDVDENVPINHAPYLVIAGGYNEGIVRVVEGSTLAVDVNAVDIDDDPYLFELLTSADSAMFDFDQNSGEATFKTPIFYGVEPPDANGDGLYEIQVKVTDDGGLSDTITIYFEITKDPIQNFILFDLDGQSSLINPFNYPENFDDIFNTTATSSKGHTLSYSILSGDDGALFSIDPITARLKWVLPPNFEAPPADANGDDIYKLTVRATSDQNFDTGDVKLYFKIADEPDSPVFDILTLGRSVNNPFMVNEGTLPVGSVHAVHANPITYQINTGDDSSLFNIDPDGGSITLKDPMDYENLPTDSNNDGVFELQVNARASTAEEELQQVFVSIADVEEQSPPVFLDPGTGSSLSAPVEVDENFIGIGSFSATHPNTVSYSLGDVQDNSLINYAATGQLFFKTAPNYEYLDLDADNDGIYHFVLTASQGLWSASRDLYVKVRDVAPETSLPFFVGSNTISVKSGAKTNFGSLVAISPTTKVMRYAVVGGPDSSKFNVAAITGKLSFKEVVNHSFPADSDLNNIYEVDINAQEIGGLNTVRRYFVEVKSSGLTISNYTNAAVVGYQATSGVTNVGGLFSQLPDGVKMNFALQSGADNSKFNINKLGQISFKTAPNTSTPSDVGRDNVYRLNVLVTYGIGKKYLIPVDVYVY